uniref:Uncharacterized protein n=1 Tax=viral metagenome TaxID=1070528 RepID=A0A6H1ZJN0_9ZZZZ
MKLNKLLIALFIFVTLLSATTILSQQQKQIGQPEASLFEENLFQVYVPFLGQWLPDVASELIGFQNFKTLQNMRYVDGGIEGVQGYSKINTSVVDASYYKPRSGYHFKKDRPAESHVLLQCYNYDGTLSKVYQNKTPIPNQGNFEAAPIHTDASYGTFTGIYGHHTLAVQELASADATHGIFVGISELSADATHGIVAEEVDVTAVITHDTPRARFSKGPMGTVIYSNGVESKIWSGDETLVAAFISSDADVTEYVTNGKDYTEQVNNEFSTLAESAGVSGYGSGGTAYFLVGTVRPASGLSFYVSAANLQVNNKIEISEWTGPAWSDLIETDSSGLTVDGKVSFASTVETSKPKYLEGRLLYWYLCQVQGGASIYNVTADLPWQNLVDIWDLVYRAPITFQASRSQNYEDWTSDVNTSSSDLYPIGAEVGGLKSTDHIIVGFENRVQAIYFDILSGNTEGFGPNTVISTWNGTAYVASGTTYDATGDIAGVTPLGQTGALKWDPPSKENEFSQYLFGVYGYFYKIKYGGTLGGTDAKKSAVIIDRVYGIPVPVKPYNFKFATFYKNRIFLCGYLKGNVPNRIDYCMANGPDIWNGAETSDDGRSSLYIGGGEELTSAIQIYNRYGANVYNNLVIFKNNETYLLIGDGPEDFQVHSISENIGCPAPYSLTTAELGYEMIPGELQRNVAIWLSSTGPYMFDGSVMLPIRGIDKYFDQNDDDYVGINSLIDAFAWYDTGHSEWNLRVSDYWFVYDFVRKRWYLKNVGAAEKPRCVFQVTNTGGNKHIYAGMDDGYMRRLDYGTDWDGTAIEQIVETGDFFLDGSGWHQTLLRRLKVESKVIDEAATLQVMHYRDTSSSGTSILSVDLSSGSNISNRTTKPLNHDGRYHRLKFSTETSGTTKGFQPLGLGYQYYVVREDKN